MRSGSPKKPVTRYGTVKSSEAIFGTEERFAWQNAKFASDVAYNLPEGKPSKSVVFGNSLRTGDDSNPDAKKSSTGPGSYDTSHSLEFNSEHATSRMTRFGAAPRQSMAMKTPSPGAVYNIEKQFWNGPEKGIAIGFNCDHRPPLYGNSAGSNADMFVPKSSTGVAITIASRFKQKNPGRGTPGAIYDVHELVNFKTGPAYSFGKGRGDRFQQVGFLPELD